MIDEDMLDYYEYLDFITEAYYDWKYGVLV